MVLCYSPDRLARKFAYQALLIEELARCGVRVEFINNGARGDSPEDQLLVRSRACSPRAPLLMNLTRTPHRASSSISSAW